MSETMAARMMGEQGIAEGDDRTGVQETATDQALRKLTGLTVEYTGTARGIRIDGAPDEVIRMAGVLPQSVGAGLLLALTGFGIVDPPRRDAKAGRFAANDDDCFETYFRMRPTADHYGWANDPATGYYVQRELVVEVPCPAGVTTLLAGLAMVDVGTATTSSSVLSRFVLGEGPETYGDPSPRNFGGKLGPIVRKTGGDRPGMIANMHIRTVIPAGERGSSVKQACSFRLQSDTTAAGNTIGAAWMLVARIPI